MCFIDAISLIWICLLKKDKFGAIVHQPLRAESGELTLRIPMYSDYLGNIYSADEKLNLEASGREINYEYFYQKDFDEFKIRLTSILVKDGGHISTENLEKVFMLELKSEI